jgi:hypothetical protein
MAGGQSTAAGGSIESPGVQALGERVRLFWRQISRLARRGAKPTKSLRLCQSLNLGERRFVAVVAYEEQRFLLGGTGTSVVLLSRLGDAAAASAENRDSVTRKWQGGVSGNGLEDGGNQGEEGC